MRGRTRIVKPDIHSDSELWDLEQESGLPVFRAFVGLWNFADREGRFEWKPRQLCALVLPFWGGDFSRVLDALVTRGFLVKYASGGAEFGVVRTFRKHQSPNNRESPSSIPPPPGGYEHLQALSDASTTRHPRVSDAVSTPLDGIRSDQTVLDQIGVYERVAHATPAPPLPPISVSDADAPLPFRAGSSPGGDSSRFMQPLEDAVRSEFFARDVTPQKAGAKQWRDGCQTVADAVAIGAFADALAAIDHFAVLVVNACADGEKLGFALQQVTITKPRIVEAPVYRIREGA